MRLQRGRAADDIDIIIDSAAWSGALPGVERLVEQAAGAAFRHATGDGADSSCAILLGDDAALQALNRQFRGLDKPTNVLSFPADAAPPLPAEAGPRSWGDVAIAFETARREAAEQGKSLADHLAHLVVHGLLHLLGHDHEVEAEAEAMEALEREILQSIGIADPYAGDAPQAVAR